MLFKNEEASLKLDIVNYEFPPETPPVTTATGWFSGPPGPKKTAMW